MNITILKQRNTAAAKPMKTNKETAKERLQGIHRILNPQRALVAAVRSLKVNMKPKVQGRFSKMSGDVCYQSFFIR